MSFPNKYYGVIENPIIFNPYVVNNDNGTAFSSNGFLLLNHDFFLLLNGSELLLL